MRRRHTVIITVLLLLLSLEAAATHAEQSLFLPSQAYEGTTTLYRPEEWRAVIHDAGAFPQAATPGRSRLPTWDQLADDGVKEVVISCSHTHRDHSAGVKQLIREAKGVERIERITFIDPVRGGKASAYESFRSLHQKSFKGRVAHQYASDGNVFGGVLGSKQMANFVGTVPARGHVHESATLLMSTLRSGQRVIRTADLDDNSDRRVRQWAKWVGEDLARRRPDILIAAHHLSNNNSLDAIPKEIAPSVLIVTVDEGNRYGHPGEHGLAKAVDRFHPDYILFTGVDGPIEVTATEIRYRDPTRHRQRVLEQILEPRMHELESELEELEGSMAHGGDAERRKTREATKEARVALAELSHAYAVFMNIAAGVPKPINGPQIKRLGVRDKTVPGFGNSQRRRSIRLKEFMRKERLRGHRRVR